MQPVPGHPILSKLDGRQHCGPMGGKVVRLMRGLLASGVLLLPIVVAIGLAGGFLQLWDTTYPSECGRLCRESFWESATLQDVRAELDSGADPNASDFSSMPGYRVWSKRTPLQLAVEQSNRTPTTIRLLLDYGADPNPTTTYRYEGDLPLNFASRRLYGAHSPLYLASRLLYEGDREIIEMLLDYGADINSRTGPEGLTPLHLAIIDDRDLELIEMFLERSADVKARDNKGRTPLHLAAGNNDQIGVVQYLLSRGADVDGRDAYGETPLHVAVAKNKNIEIVEFLLKRGAEVDARDENGETSLHIAVAKNKNIEIVEFLLKRGAEVDARDENGETTLHWAIRTQWDNDVALQRIQLLLDHGADPAATNILEDSSLHMTNGRVELAQLLLDSGADAGAVNNKGETVLHWAFMYGTNFEFTELLLSRGANVNISDDTGRSVLHSAMYGAAGIEIVALLLDHGASPNAATHSGEAVLFVALYSNPNLEVVNMLISHGADVNILPSRSSRGLPIIPPLQLALRNRVPLAVLETLVRNGADLEAVDLWGNTACQLANRFQDDGRYDGKDIDLLCP